MLQARIIVETQFTLERRVIQRRGAELLPQTTYQLFYFINSGTTQFSTQTCALCNPGEALLIEKGQDKSEILVVSLAAPFLIETATRLNFFRSGSNLLFSQPQVQDQKLSAVLEVIHNEMVESASGWREIIKSLVHQLTVYVLRAHVNLKRSEELELSRVGIVDRRLRRAIEFMHDNCGRELTLTEIAASVYISEFHFARLFKKITGSTPHTYLAAIRIERARKMLTETDLAITEIGARVGYNSQSHFTKIFREATGMTPHAFREAAQ